MTVKKHHPGLKVVSAYAIDSQRCGGVLIVDHCPSTVRFDNDGRQRRGGVPDHHQIGMNPGLHQFLKVPLPEKIVSKVTGKGAFGAQPCGSHRCVSGRPAAAIEELLGKYFLIRARMLADAENQIIAGKACAENVNINCHAPGYQFSTCQNNVPVAGIS